MDGEADAPKHASPPSDRSRKAVRIAHAVLGVVALLDLSTSAFPSFIDVFEPVPRWPLVVRAVELALACSILPATIRFARGTLVPLVGTLPISRTACAILGLYLLGALLAVAFRTEAFPFSNVGMFSAVPRSVDVRTPRREPTVVFVAGRRVKPISVLREGSALASDLHSGWDYKVGWTMWMFGTSDSHALEHATALARARGFDRAVRAVVTFDPLTGRPLRLEPFARRR